MIQGSAIYLEEGGLQGGPCPLMVLKEMPSLTHPAHTEVLVHLIMMVQP